ncbi:MAG TPA: NADH-quinone oxidoreductase subunit N [Fimbriimonadaceae bacterium]|jgi:NADH-quinone oxidoreductase subunit N
MGEPNVGGDEMNPQYTQSFPIPQIDFNSVLPMIIVTITGLVALLIEILRPPKKNKVIVAVSLIGLLGAAAVLLQQFGMPEGETLAGMMIVDRFGLVMQLLVVLSCFLCICFSESYLRQKRIPFGEFYPLILWSSVGAMLMATSKNLLVIFLGLEVLSIALYVMAGMSRSEEKSEESAVKYFLLGAFASGFLLYGIAFFYGASGSLRIDDLASTWASGDPTAHVLLIMGLGLMLIGFSFKSAFVPFHQWTPDVYQGAPTNVTAFMAAGSKIAAIAALYRVLDASGAMAIYWIPAMSVVAILTMTIGNLIALMQKDVKRILGYSSIAHAGYILVAIIAHGKSASSIPAGDIGFSTTAYYLLSYSVMTIGAFAIISLVAKNGREKTTLDDLHGLYKREPFAAVMLVIFMASLIGIPPTAGFVGKLLIFNDALSAHLGVLAIVLAINSIISIAYYLAIARAAFIAEEGEEKAVSSTMGTGAFSAAAICGIFVIGLALFASPIVVMMQSDYLTSQSTALKQLPAKVKSVVVQR